MTLRYPTSPKYTKLENQARQYTKKGNKFYKSASYCVPGNNYPELPGIDLTKVPFKVSDFILLLQQINEVLTDANIVPEVEHCCCGGDDRYGCDCEYSGYYTITGKVAFIPDDKLRAAHESAALKEKQYRTELKEYDAAKKAEAEAAQYKNFLRLKKKFEGNE
jgi:hypothetical protein